MVKFENEYAKVLYKRSFINDSKTSTTNSNQTKVTKKSSNIRMKSSHHKVFCTVGGKMKRNFSIETDLCKIKRRFKQKLMKLSNADAKSAYTAKMPVSGKSRYSKYTEETSMGEFRSDNSGCGDNRHADRSNHHYMNKEDLMYNNLNELFKTWVQQILQDKDLKSLIHTAFETAIKSSGTRKEGKSSSCTTYVLEDKNNKSTNTSQDTKCLNSLSYIPPSFFTVPITYKTLRLISTLSIPKNLHGRKRKLKRTKIQTYKIKKRPNKKMLMALIQSEKNFDVESDIYVDMIEVVTKSWLKQCVNTDEKVKEKMCPQIPHIVCWANLLPPITSTCKYGPQITKLKVSKNSDGHHDTKNVKTNTATTSKINNFRFDSSHRLIRGRGDTVIKKQHVSTEYSCHKTSIKTSKILQGNNRSHPVTQNIYYPAVIFKKRQSEKVYSKASKKDIAVLCKRAISNIRICDDYQCKHFTHLCRKVKRNTKKKGNVMNNLQNVLNCFVNDTNKNFKLDLHVSASPISPTTYRHTATEAKKEKEHIITSGETVSKIPSITMNEINEQKYQGAGTGSNNSQNIHKIEQTSPELINKKRPPTIIPLLDGAASKTKYVFKTDSTTINPQYIATNAIVNEDIQDQAPMNNKLGIKDEINEIKLALLNITHLVNTCLVSQHNKKHRDCSLSTVDKSLERALQEGPKTIIPAVKINRNKIKCTGIKLSKEGRNSHSTKIDSKQDLNRKKQSFENNVINAIESYHIIESESLIEVTNMTTYSGQKVSNTKDVALTCSLPLDRSLYEVSDEKQRQELTNYFKTPIKHELALPGYPFTTQHDRTNLKHRSLEITTHGNPCLYGPKPKSSFTKPTKLVKCDTCTNHNIISCKRVEKTKSTTYNTIFQKDFQMQIDDRRNIESHRNANSAANCESITMKPRTEMYRSYGQENSETNIFSCQNNIQTTKNMVSNNVCQRNISYSGSKHSVSCQISSNTQAKILPNNTERYKMIVSYKTEDMDNQNDDAPTTSFCCQSFFAKTTEFPSNTDDILYQKEKKCDGNSIENAQSTDLQTTRLSLFNANDTTTTTEAITTSAKDLMQRSPEQDGVQFHTKKSSSFNKTYTVNFGDDSDSKVKPTHNKTSLHFMKKCIFLTLPILVTFVLAFSYMLINKKKTLEETNTAKARREIPSYASLNLSELGF